MSKIHLIQHGVDGMGHQLHGIIGCLALHNIKDYYFDGVFFINKVFSFQHIKGQVSLDVKNYFIEILKNFIEKFNQKTIKYNNSIHSHEIYKIPDNYNSNTLYSLDNVFYFDKIPINDNEKLEFKNNIQDFKDFYINDKLPKNRLNENNIVIHIRLGDAMYTSRRPLINKHNNQLIKLLYILIQKYENYTFYFHTDGNIDFIKEIFEKFNVDYKIFLRDEHILNTLSDLIHSKILIGCHSSLSTAATFLGNHELVIIPDDLKHSVNSNCIRIGDYILKNE